MTKNTTPIWRLKFKEPPLEGEERTEFFFTSLSAVFDLFTPEQVGRCLASLYNLKITDGNPWLGGKCEVHRESARGKAQKSPYKRPKESE